MGNCLNNLNIPDLPNIPGVTAPKESAPSHESNTHNSAPETAKKGNTSNRAAPGEAAVAKPSGKPNANTNKAAPAKAAAAKPSGKPKAKTKPAKSNSAAKPKPKPNQPGTRGAAAKKKDDGIPEEYRKADPKKWKLVELKFAGQVSYESIGEQQVVKKPISEGIEHFKANPGKYIAMTYQADMVGWPEDQQQYTYIHRMGTVNYKPKGASPSGWMAALMWEYEALPPFKDNEFPAKFRDKYTDEMTHRGRKLHSANNKPILPGRGMGVCDNPMICIIDDIDPSDIHQGSVGDCWLLSAISALAEFDGAVKKLYRKTKDLDKRPFDGPNQYIITLWDLPTGKEVDIVIDERLPAMADGTGRLLASRPSEDGELWVNYLEKALAIHCGGWDKITGGQCTHGWALMTGCKYQYMITKNEKTGKYGCYGQYNTHTKKWNRQANSPHDGDHSMWPMPWPEVGGGGEGELTEDELFLKMVAWDEENYIVGAGTKGTSDKNQTGGLVDNHAYSVIESHSNVCGTGIDLLKVRNPWGKGEIEDGEFDDDGPGWDKYPQIKKKLNPVVADDGIFWVTKQEFFHFYQTIYLSASNMTEFLED